MHTRAALFLTSVFCGASLSAQDRPNIIVFLVDDMGIMDTSVPFLTDNQGQPKKYELNDWYHTPNMERMAEQGIRFSNFYAQSVSSPSRTSLLTGQNAARHGTTNWIDSKVNNRTPYGPHDWNWEGLTRETPCFPKLLQKAGFKTIHVGKAHFGCEGSEGEDPRNVGFDVNIGGNSIGQPGSYYGEYGYGWLKGDHTRPVPNLDKYHRTNTFLTEALTLEACHQIELAVKEKKPFYLNMAHYAVHAPYDPDPRFIDRYRNRGNNRHAENFAALIEGMDKSLGDIMDKLQELGIAENTLIIFLGDNGGDAPLGEANEHACSAPLKGRKGSEFEGGMRVPFIASWGAVDPQNKYQQEFPIVTNGVQLQMATIMDIYPTVLSVAGVKRQKGYVLDGSDLKRLFQGKKDRGHRDDFLMHFPYAHRGNYFTIYRKDYWKLIYYYRPENPIQPKISLYEMKGDPFEYKDVVTVYPKVAKSLFNKMVEKLEEEGALYPVDKEGRSLKPFFPESLEKECVK